MRWMRHYKIPKRVNVAGTLAVLPNVTVSGHPLAEASGARAKKPVPQEAGGCSLHDLLQFEATN